MSSSGLALNGIAQGIARKISDFFFQPDS